MYPDESNNERKQENSSFHGHKVPNKMYRRKWFSTNQMLLTNLQASLILWHWLALNVAVDLSLKRKAQENCNIQLM